MFKIHRSKRDIDICSRIYSRDVDMCTDKTRQSITKADIDHYMNDTKADETPFVF